MNNTFKKRFLRKLGLFELIVECEKVSAFLCENELDEDFKSCTKNSVNYIQGLPLLKTAIDSYTRRIYNEFEEEFKGQFSFSGKLLQTEGSISTFMVTLANMHIAFKLWCNSCIDIADKTITCFVESLNL